MTLYHGTNVEFHRIDLSKSNRFKDFAYQKLIHTENGLYEQSPSYVYELLDKEYHTGIAV